jgi:hypothetical protein
MAVLDDFFDPNTWLVDKHECRVYADDYANEYAIVDQIDYQYLIQWRWKLKESKSSKGTKKPKVYLARTTHEGSRESRICSTIFLHTVVMERTGTPKPKTNKKLIVDHKDSDGLNCKRNNLRYATLSFNRRNRNGVHEHVLELV